MRRRNPVEMMTWSHLSGRGPGARDWGQPHEMIGVVVNPKTFAPCFACTTVDVHRLTSPLRYSDNEIEENLRFWRNNLMTATEVRNIADAIENQQISVDDFSAFLQSKPPRFVDIYDDFDTRAVPRQRSSWAGRGSYEHPYSSSGFPVVHTGGDDSEGVRDKNRGYGTALYAALCLGATLASRGQIVIAPKPDAQILKAEEGIASDQAHRTDDAATWWRKAIAHGMAYSEDGFDNFPFKGGAERFCVVVGVSDWFSTTYKGSPAETMVAPDVLATLNLAGCDPRVVAYLEKVAKLHGATKEFRKAMAVADVVEHNEMRANPGWSAKERKLLEERDETIEALGLDVPFSD